MPIQILPPQLANQIAAGEVVERPASVVKELVENALDAGASQVEIEIDKGGHKRILIRDNGKGIDKEELGLALSRHATSKITAIDDLEAIVSLGFRGEALASISSVSRLTMTSKPLEQKEAWSAIAEGLDMAVKVLPAAHPNGTSVEVLDLFFNTPARRKFLRAEKTEFSHIEALIKRIGLSRPDITFILKHNGKLVKRYRSQTKVEDEVQQKSNRIAEVISQHFVDSANVVSSHYDQVKISVWVKQPSLCVSVNPAQFSFVNGRMMRDKLIQHAIRQAYGSELGSEQLPEYVVFIDLPAQDVDVNVHPAKHEVRFHYARLLHDLLVKTMEEALAGFNHQQQVHEEAVPDWIETSRQNYRDAQAATEIVKSELKQAESSSAHSVKMNSFPGLKPVTEVTKQRSFIDKNPFSNEIVTDSIPLPKSTVNDRALQQAVKQEETLFASKEPSTQQTLPRQNESLKQASSKQFEVVFVEQDRFYYFKWQQSLWVMDTSTLFADDAVMISGEQLVSAPLLVPIRLKLSDDEKSWCNQHNEFLIELGFEVKLHQDFLIIKQVPSIIRSAGSTHTLPNFVSKLMTVSEPNRAAFNQIVAASRSSTLSANQKQQKLSQFVEENKLNLHRVATELNAQSLCKGK